MGTATNKANKAQTLRKALLTVAHGTDVLARDARKVVRNRADSWMRRTGTAGNFHAPKGQTMAVKASVPRRTAG